MPPRATSTRAATRGLVPSREYSTLALLFALTSADALCLLSSIYLEPWHADIFDFLDLRKNHGKEEVRARDLFYALWIPDLLSVLI